MDRYEGSLSDLNTPQQKILKDIVHFIFAQTRAHRDKNDQKT